MAGSDQKNLFVSLTKLLNLDDTSGSLPWTRKWRKDIFNLGRGETNQQCVEGAEFRGIRRVNETVVAFFVAYAVRYINN